MNFENKIRNISTPYISQRVGTPIAEMAKVYDTYQGRQDTVLNSRNELLDAFDSAGAMLDDEDRKMFGEYTKKTLDDLKGLSENEYVGNLDRKLRSDAERFKTIHGQFAENSTRKQKFKESLVNSGLPDAVQQRYVELAKQKSGKFTYNPITGQATNKFVPLTILKDPDPHKYVAELDGLIPTTEKTYYLNSKTGKRSLYQQEGFDQEEHIKEKQLTSDIQKKVENRIAQDYTQNYQRNIELGGKEYADKEYKRLVGSVINGLSISSYNNTDYKLDDIEKDKRKEESKIKIAEAKASKDSDIMSSFVLPTVRNYKNHDFKTMSDINTKMDELQATGDKESVNNLGNYRSRIEKKYGIKYGVDYDTYNYGVTKGLHIINDSKKGLIEQANADLAKDMMGVTQLNKSYVFDKPSEQASLTRGFQDALGNLSDTHAFSTDKMMAEYHPENNLSGEPLSKEQMSKIKNVSFSSIQLTPNGVYYTGRSNGSTKEQNAENSTDSDFTFKIKAPNGNEILKGMINSNRIKPEEAYAYQLTQGLEGNYGANKKIQINGKPDLVVKKFLPSDNDGSKLKNKSNEEFNKTGYAVYLEGYGLIKTVPDYQSLLDVITAHIKTK